MGTLEQNMEARISAEFIVGYAIQEIETFEAEGKIRFWELIAAHAAKQLPQPVVKPEDQPMTTVQAGRFSTLRMPYGKHLAEMVCDVPLDYLVWLAEDADEFKKELRRYIKSKVIQQEQEVANGNQ